MSCDMPALPPKAAPIVVVPPALPCTAAAAPVCRPMVATLVLVELQLFAALAVISCVLWSVKSAIPMYCKLLPGKIEAVGGTTAILVTIGGVTVSVVELLKPPRLALIVGQA